MGTMAVCAAKRIAEAGRQARATELAGWQSPPRCTSPVPNATWDRACRWSARRGLASLLAVR